LIMTEIIILIGLLFFSAFFSSIETAFTSLSYSQIRHVKNKRKVKIIDKFYNKPDMFLSTVLIGNNLVNISITAISTTLTTELFGSEFIGAMTGILTIIILIFGELIPKQIAITNNMVIIILFIDIINIISIILFPILKMFSLILRLITKLVAPKKNNELYHDNLIYLIRKIENLGIIDSYRSNILKNTIKLNNIKVKTAMTHRKDIFSLDSELILKDALDTIKKSNFKYIPIYKDNKENIIGLINEKDIFENIIKNCMDVKLKDIKKEVLKIPETLEITKVFDELIRNDYGIAIVFDEYGGLSGLVTDKDIMLEFIGEEYKNDFKLIKKDNKNNCYLIKGETSLFSIENYFNIEIKDIEDTDTISGYIIKHLSRIPLKDELVTFEFGTFITKTIESSTIEELIFYKNIEED